MSITRKKTNFFLHFCAGSWLRNLIVFLLFPFKAFLQAQLNGPEQKMARRREREKLKLNILFQKILSFHCCCSCVVAVVLYFCLFHSGLCVFRERERATLSSFTSRTFRCNMYTHERHMQKVSERARCIWEWSQFRSEFNVLSKQQEIWRNEKLQKESTRNVFSRFATDITKFLFMPLSAETRLREISSAKVQLHVYAGGDSKLSITHECTLAFPWQSEWKWGQEKKKEREDERLRVNQMHVMKFNPVASENWGKATVWEGSVSRTHRHNYLCL
jgi:hypothetical protein